MLVPYGLVYFAAHVPAWGSPSLATPSAASSHQIIDRDVLPAPVPFPTVRSATLVRFQLPPCSFPAALRQAVLFFPLFIPSSRGTLLRFPFRFRCWDGQRQPWRAPVVPFRSIAYFSPAFRTSRYQRDARPIRFCQSSPPPPAACGTPPRSQYGIRRGVRVARIAPQAPSATTATASAPNPPAPGIRASPHGSSASPFRDFPSSPLWR